MDECDRIGIEGDCGFECPVFLQSDCSIADEMLEEANEEERQIYFDIYGE